MGRLGGGHWLGCTLCVYIRSAHNHPLPQLGSVWGRPASLSSTGSSGLPSIDISRGPRTYGAPAEAGANVRIIDREIGRIHTDLRRIRHQADKTIADVLQNVVGIMVYPGWWAR